MASLSAFDTHVADQKVKTLVNAQLKTILKREKLAVSGLKAAMQNRIIGQLHQYAVNRDLDKLNRLKGMINNPEALHSPAQPASSYQAPFNNASLNVAQQPGPVPVMASGSSVPARLMFKDSPFYTILQALTPVQECKVREATRDHVDSKIIFRSDVAEKLTLDPDLRVMIFCASEPVSQFSKLEIAFPHQVEIKVNMDEVKANLRGLKNKPGSTRPADITTLLRKRANYENSMNLTYALTHKKFYFVANLVKRHPVEELVNKLKVGKMISKEQVIKESNGSEHVTEMSLINTPDRCALSIDDLYVDGILKSTPRSVDQVTIEPDGKWLQLTEGALLTKRDHDSSSDDEDLIELKDPPRVAAVKSETMNGAGSMRTPPTSSREQSSSSVPPPSGGTKRSMSTVIDLVSDDEDEENQRPSKRPLIPPYPVMPTYSSDHIRAQGEHGSSAPFGLYPTNMSSVSHRLQRAYPHPP
ncbi:MAG: hypothetical protein Q9218_000838 [Villophora microphyllina]